VEGDKQVLMNERAAKPGSADAEANEDGEVNVDEEIDEDDFRCQLDGDVETSLRKGRPLFMPTEAQIEDHRLTHVPYRSWCRHCVLGRALGEKRGATTGRPHSIPRVGLDYFFITAEGTAYGRRGLVPLGYPDDDDGDAKLTEARRTGQMLKCLIVRCYDSKVVIARIVPQKGIDEDRLVIDLVISDLKWLGHSRVLLKCDNEPAITALTNAVCEAAKSEGLVQTASVEHSPATDSQANGGTEVGVKLVRGLFRSLRSCLEQRIGRKLPMMHPLTSWLLEHTSNLLSVSVRGTDGVTPWARVRGRPFGLQILNFGERCNYKLRTKGPEHDDRGNMMMRHEQGVFLGYDRSTNEYILYGDGELRRTRAVMRCPFEERWCAKDLEAVDRTPWSSAERKEPKAVLGEEVMKDPPPQPGSNLPRKFKVLRTDLRNRLLVILKAASCARISDGTESTDRAFPMMIGAEQGSWRSWPRHRRVKRDSRTPSSELIAP